MSGVNRLGPALTDENAGELLEASRGLTIAQLERLISSRAAPSETSHDSVVDRRSPCGTASSVRPPETDSANETQEVVIRTTNPRLVQKLERARTLLAGHGPLADDEVLERALDLLIEHETRRLQPDEAGNGVIAAAPPPRADRTGLRES